MSARDRFVEALRSRRMLQPSEEWVVDANLNAYAHELVAATLRTVAEQIRSSEERVELLSVAEAVAQGQDDDCCPLCQEVTCDSGCPLSEVRAAKARHT